MMRSASTLTRHGVAGMSLTELMIGMTVVAVLMGAVLTSGDLVSRTLSDRRGDALEAMRRAGVQLANHLRGARRGSLQMRATGAEAAALGVPAGQWIAAPVGVPHASLSFETTHGEQASGGRVELEFVLESGEALNSEDDDGDGLVDEGTLQAKFGTVRLAVLAQAESCAITFDGRLVHVAMHCGRRASGGKVFRATSEHFVTLRNE